MSIFSKTPKTSKAEWKYDNVYNGWKFFGVVGDGQELVINGLNVWSFDWHSTGENVMVKDPLYGEDKKLAVYKISNSKTEVTFATTEFSNCVWGFYLKVQ